jgi:hypothetical protein
MFTELKVIGFCLIFSLVMLALCSFFKPEAMMVWSHLSSVFGGYLVGGARATTRHPP